ncbi:MAG: helix-turn-helix domain-containing protein [Limnoraphis robusta]|uniref:HxlR family transcriptional regulator n=2 Tax=Limnoraphis robusta TaxID=1118279 RepID=A0A0F5Y9J2_9CYAN|nr:helix-turn-helix domain-containing protein [Limnoraphis robusta]KKD35566.1 HxlR family transcriptional regulator [Limnoraphis robusta CS-951]MEA5499484.1 helix-turn-helix domain-containing protein [Limnoraphis robusta BA-68 BA1]MEA5517635.1 helix-turn-helix domain-containing protein [Limnoraphis robusta CCNP1315]MEA5539595.1 helix-turn-helix domain-containing protein [Limnoraphis robusta Tam1]MEA5544357.1 helix-turn-helix domain-containing protein [Limnoraphis robusta CCNP1324]
MQAPQEQSKKENCPAETTLALINGRWKLLILRELFSGVKRFNQLQRSLTGVTQKMLTQHLREMEADGLVYRKVYPEIPPKVEYSLTSTGESLKPLIEKMHEWGIEKSEVRSQKSEVRSLELPHEI